MSAYRYHALNPSGQVVKGSLEADTPRQARQLLRKQGLMPTQIIVLTNQAKSQSKKKLSIDNLCLITRQMATLLNAGVPIDEALKAVSDQQKKRSIHEILMAVYIKVLAGHSLAHALAEFPDSFPEIYQATIHAGEQTGRLDLILENLANYLEKQNDIKTKVQHAFIYPSLMITVSGLIVIFLLTYIVPRIIEVFAETKQALPLMTQILISLCNAIKSYGMMLSCLLILILVGLKLSLRKPNFKLSWDRFLLKIPIYSYFITMTNLTRYLYTFNILFTASVSILETMNVSARLLNNLHLRNLFFEATIKVKEGLSITEALNQTGYIRTITHHLLASGEKTGQLGPMSQRAAIYLDNEINRIITTALSLLEPGIILLMGFVVLFIVLATLLPIFSMEQLMG